LESDPNFLILDSNPGSRNFRRKGKSFLILLYLNLKILVESVAQESRLPIKLRVKNQDLKYSNAKLRYALLALLRSAILAESSNQLIGHFPRKG